ncbi:7-cyano-7-deazaguanine synthase in queuosine biosynthesis [Rudaeicoccus suwonensis]|uniref:7-cyano-7-deazaguanine synthase in queuosine biosynthesis n=2 Tax=Rudaeicoccus suwonensis TaxID=657409 RepID=A0A561EAG2_9MICO|nr:7-cyano-7-deazaguanine synthase in queuosine biosynthesis [Rudaeicoccus suwonensis]
MPDGARFVELYARPGNAHGLTAGASILQEVRRAHLEPSLRAWDFLSIALAAVVADAATLRRNSPDGWTREISLDLALAEPEAWKPYLSVLTSALRFLTTDIWDIEITTTATVPFKTPTAPATHNADCVALLSGGLDSLIGGIDLVQAGRKPFFVSHTVRGDAAKQEDFATRLGVNEMSIRLNHSTKARSLAGSDETSQRVRSLIFIAYAVLAASTIISPNGGPVDLYINENGFISINPPLTPMRVGSLSTRTAHPRFLGLLQQLLDATGLNVRLINPYRLRTKGQMLAECKNQKLLAELADRSTSCGRFQRYNYRHCGRCLPCQVRRAAFLAWNRPDGTEYVFSDLGRKDNDHSAFDDVRAVAIARLTVEEDGFAYWAGGSLSWVPLSERDAVRVMLKHGILELGELHDHYQVT